MPSNSIIYDYNPAAIATKLLSSPFAAIAIRPLSSISLPPPTHQHIARLILDQRSASQALQTFRWASRLPNFAHDHSTYRALIHKLCSSRRFDTVHQLLDEMPRSIGSPPDETIFVTIVRGLGRARMTRQAIRVLDLLPKYNCKPTLKLFNSILDVLVKEDIDLARNFYRQAMMGQGDDYTFGILMKGLCSTNRIGDAFKLLQLIKSRGVTPNTVIYNTLIHALCKNGKMGRARSLMLHEMTAPNALTFNILISAYCRHGDLIPALVLLDNCFALDPFSPHLVIAVTKVVQLLCSVGRVSEAVEVFQRVESSSGVLDVAAYNTLIKGFCRLGKVQAARRLLKEMETKGCFPNVETYNTLISGFCECGLLDSALDLFHDMKADAVNWNSVTYSLLIQGLCSVGRTEDGLKILRVMEENDRKPSSVTPYNSVIYGLYKESRWDEALEFLAGMGRLFPRMVNRSLRILNFCTQSSAVDAKKVFDQMIWEGGIPSAYVYHQLIHSFCQEGCVKEAFELLKEMVGRGCIPVASTFNALITEFCNQGEVGSASKLLEDIFGKGCLPDKGSYSPLLHAMCRKGDFQNAFILSLQMLEKGILPDISEWNSLLLSLTQDSAWLEASDIAHVNSGLQQIIEL